MSARIQSGAPSQPGQPSGQAGRSPGITTVPELSRGRSRKRGSSQSEALDYMSSRRRWVVGLLKVFLPCAAVGLAGVLVIWSILDQPVSQDDVALLGTIKQTADGSVELGAKTARFYGQDQMGQPFTITAEQAVHTGPKPEEVDLIDLQADMVLNSGMWITVGAPEGLFYHKDKILMLDGGINIFSDRGYEFFTDVILLDLAAGTATSEAPIKGQGPFGVVQADRFRATDMGKKLYFDGSVKGTIYPVALRQARLSKLDQGKTQE